MDASTIALLALSFTGFIVSVYALYVKHNLAAKKNYRPVCDVNDRVSCTKALGSEYSSLFILPNSFFGMFFYGVLALLSFFREIQALLVLSLLAVIGSFYLAYVSFFKLRVLCPLCTIIYAVNIALLAVSGTMLW